MTEKIEAFWADATADDVAEIINTRKPIPARFRDEETEGWLDCSLVGWRLSKHLPGARWIDSDGAMWNLCQVYREPSWYANKPDPGPGYRLLGKFPDELVMGGDFVYNYDKWWMELLPGCNPTQGAAIWYRRRIEPVEPEPKHYVLRVGDTVETLNGHIITVVSPSVEQVEYKLTAGYTATLPSGQKITVTETGFEVTQ
jgi:hypothetical protein